MTRCSLRGWDSRGLLLTTLTAILFGLSPVTARASSTSRSLYEDTSQSQKPARELSVGVPVERELAGTETDWYEVALTAGQYVQIGVEQKGIDVVVSLFSPDAQQITGVDGPDGPQGVESVSAIADAAGKYRLEVKALDKKAKAGRYQVTLEHQRVAIPEDRVRIAAEKVLADGDRLRAQDTAESQRKAIEKYMDALPLLRAASDSREALALHRIGVVSWQLGDSEKALTFFNQALPLWRAMGDRMAEARTLQGVSSSYTNLGVAGDFDRC